ncbi:50S ribosomal subunit protein L32 [Candidatus Tremblaya phenacola PAVE]|nr:50S ribosomal subunit protein L32 [Candidatus Tremblaya phenacola PAVE]
MAVPKKKRSKSKRGMRRSHQKIRLLTAFENVVASQVHIRHYGIRVDSKHFGKDLFWEGERRDIG